MQVQEGQASLWIEQEDYCVLGFQLPQPQVVLVEMVVAVLHPLSYPLNHSS